MNPRSPCGIDCAACEIYKAARDPAEAEKLAAAWRASWQPKASAEWFVCQGCRGDRSLCWSEDCKIYPCASARGVGYCSDCGDFPCEMLSQWAQDPGHQAALEWLKSRK